MKSRACTMPGTGLKVSVVVVVVGGGGGLWCKVIIASNPTLLWLNWVELTL